jgi:ribosomal protein S18 acetylase RimI-like enzyme
MDETMVRTRHMVRSDIPKILKHFSFTWDKVDLNDVFCTKNCVVAVADDMIVGFMSYGSYSRRRIEIFDFFVMPDARRARVGTALLEFLKTILMHGDQDRIVIRVRETDLPLQLFLKYNSFRAVKVDRGYFVNPSEDAYYFHYRLKTNSFYERSDPKQRALASGLISGIADQT